MPFGCNPTGGNGCHKHSGCFAGDRHRKQGESKVEITTGSNGDETAKQIDTTLKLYDAENNVCSIVNVPPAISLTPKGKTTIKYNSAGGLSSHSSDVNIVMTASTSRTAKLTVNRLTGTVKRVQE